MKKVLRVHRTAQFELKEHYRQFLQTQELPFSFSEYHPVATFEKEKRIS